MVEDKFLSSQRILPLGGSSAAGEQLGIKMTLEWETNQVKYHIIFARIVKLRKEWHNRRLKIRKMCRHPLWEDGFNNLCRAHD